MSTRVSRFPLYAVIVGVVIAAAGYTGFWFLARSKAEEALRAAVTEAAARGVAINFEALSFGGFPFRIEARISKLRLAAGAVSAEAENAVLTTQPWTPEHIILMASGHMALSAQFGPGQSVTLTPVQFLASYVGGAAQRIDLDVRYVKLTAMRGGNPIAADLRRVQWHMRDAGSGDPEAVFTLEGVALVQGLPPLFGPLAERFRAAGRQSGAGQWTLSAVDLDWGKLSARMTGEFGFDPLDLTLTGEIKPFAALAAALAEQGLLDLAGSAPPEDTGEQSVTLKLSQGWATLGPYALCLAPCPPK